MRVELTKQYRTVYGNAVRLSFFEEGIFYGHYKANDIWIPYQWTEVGTPPVKKEEMNAEIFEGMRLQECLEEINVSVTIFVYENGHCSTIMSVDHEFASFTVNTRVTQGESGRVISDMSREGEPVGDIRKIAREKEMNKLIDSSKK